VSQSNASSIDFFAKFDRQRSSCSSSFVVVVKGEAEIHGKTEEGGKTESDMAGMNNRAGFIVWLCISLSPLS